MKKNKMKNTWTIVFKSMVTILTSLNELSCLMSLGPLDPLILSLSGSGVNFAIKLLIVSDRISRQLSSKFGGSQPVFSLHVAPDKGDGILSSIS